MSKPPAPRLTVEEAARLVRPRDSVLCGFAAGQATGFLEALGARQDLDEVLLLTGLMVRPYAVFQNPGVRVLSGFFGPFERMARVAGSTVEYLACDFHGLERLALRVRPRVVVAVTTPPDREGWMSFGVSNGASFRAFREAAQDPERVALAEVNPHMPRIGGLPELGDNRVHVTEIDCWVEHAEELITLPPIETTPADVAIARCVADLIEDGSTLQFGIGAVPDEIGQILAQGAHGRFGIHTEMISDGVMHLHRAGKIGNRKGLYDGVTVGTFALGSAELYRWLDGNPEVRMLPVSDVNEPSLLRRLHRFVSVNAALAVDLFGQVAADHVSDRQYSGVGGHESFVTGATEAPGGKSFVCLHATANANGRRVSTIVPRLGEGTTVTTPRHHVQYVVTEYGAVDCSLLGDRSRARALVGIAHPDFRAELAAAAERIA